MIDITVDELNDTVEIEGKIVLSVGGNHSFVAMIKDILEKACYSGETITLWSVEGSNKTLVGEWYSNPRG